jgi:hypothetical protein
MKHPEDLLDNIKNSTTDLFIDLVVKCLIIPSFWHDGTCSELWSNLSFNERSDWHGTSVSAGRKRRQRVPCIRNFQELLSVV